MKKVWTDMVNVLTPGERGKFFRILLLDTAISVLDICFLLALVFVIGFYTKTVDLSNLPTAWIGWLNQYPLALIGTFLVLFIIKNGLGYRVFRAQYHFIYAVATRLSEKNLSRYLHGSFEDYVSTDSAVQIRRIIHQPVEFCHYVLRGFHLVISSALLVLFAMVPILLFNASLFLVLFMVMLPPVIITGYITKRKLENLRRNGKQDREKTIRYLQEALSGYIESNIYHRNEFFQNRFRFFQSRFNQGLSEQQVTQQLPNRLIEVFAVLGLTILIVVTQLLSPTGSTSILLIGGFMAAAYKIIPGIVRILNSLEQIKTHAYTADELLKLKPLSEPPRRSVIEPVRTIEFSRVSFSYPDEKVLDDFSLLLLPGDFAGLTGLSGKGKTTIINLLLGFLQPSRGWIAINNETTDAGDRQAYWPQVSYIKQQSFFIHDTVRNNITLEEHYEKEKLTWVMKLTGVDTMLADQPAGIETILSENGKNISGGQRQRIILARALYKEADLIILDEPFNELDRVSEDRILNHFREMATLGKIVLLITHNPESLTFCNKIISLDE